MTVRRALACALAAIGALGAGASVSACSGGGERASVASSAAAPASSPASPSTTRAGLGFRESGRGTFAASGSHHAATVTTNGTLRFAGGAERNGEMAFRTTSSDGGAPVRASDGAIEIPRGDAVERFVNAGGGVEEVWRFDKAPRANVASGDVEIDIATSGLPYTGRTASGLHFGSRAGQGIRYGDGTWVDAGGRRTVIPARWAGDHIALTVPRALLASSRYPAELDPLIGAETAIDQPSTGESQHQDRPGVGASASAFYLSWLDIRRVGAALLPGFADLYGARIDPATGRNVTADLGGVLLVPDLLYIPQIMDLIPVQTPVVVSDGNNFFSVVEAGGHIVGARVNGATGAVLTNANANADGGSATTLSLAQFSSLNMDSRIGAAYAAGKYLVVWTAGTQISLARVDAASGAIDDPGGRLVATSADGQVHPTIACNTTTCLVTWFDAADSKPHAARVDAASGATLAADANGPALALTGAQTVLATTYDATATAFVIASGVLDDDGFSGTVSASFYDPATGAVRSTPAPVAVTADAIREMQLGCDGTHVMASWPFEVSEAQGYIIQAKLESLDATTLAVGTKSTVMDSLTDATDGPSDFAVVGQESLVVGGRAATIGVEAFDQAVGVRVADSTLTVATGDTGGVALVGDANEEVHPAIASNGSGELLAWVDTRVFPSTIVATRLDATGAPLPADAAGIVLAPALSNDAKYPAIATNGTDYLVVWTDVSTSAFEGELVGASVSASTGAITGRITPVRYGSIGAGAAVSFDGTSYVAAVAAAESVTVVRIDPKTLAQVGATTVLAPISSQPTTLLSPSVASSPNGVSLVAWGSRAASTGDYDSVAAARFDATGHVLAEDVTGIRLTSSTSFQLGVAATYANNAFFVAWIDGRDDAQVGGIYGRRVPLTGALADGTPDIVVGKAPAGITGSTSDVAVADAKDGLSVQAVWSWADTLYGGLVSYAGVAREPSPLAFVGTGSEVTELALASLGGGTMELSYTRIDASSPGKNFRVFTRQLETGPLSGHCSVASDCASRYCSDGYCCDTPCDGACQTCAATPGKCTSIESAPDTGTCSGMSVCSASGTCGAVNGAACAHATECASGNCVDSVCCESACSGGCDVCNAVPGTCTVAALGSSGASPACTPYTCDGTSHACPTHCTNDQDCERPASCADDGKCELLTGAACVDQATLRTKGNATVSCAPYACDNASCLTSCRSIHDCAPGTVCDDGGKCVPPELLEASGCAISERDGSTWNGSGSAMIGGVARLLASLATRRRRRGQRQQQQQQQQQQRRERSAS